TYGSDSWKTLAEKMNLVPHRCSRSKLLNALHSTRAGLINRDSQFVKMPQLTRRVEQPGHL
ncbi:hypothetical protein SeMB42_g02895, partial [Synchytrium endobioticum]